MKFNASTGGWQIALYNQDHHWCDLLVILRRNGKTSQICAAWYIVVTLRGESFTGCMAAFAEVSWFIERRGSFWEGLLTKEDSESTSSLLKANRSRMSYTQLTLGHCNLKSAVDLGWQRGLASGSTKPQTKQHLMSVVRWTASISGLRRDKGKGTQRTLVTKYLLGW